MAIATPGRVACVFAALSFLAMGSHATAQQHATSRGMTALHGSLHAHSSLSGDVSAGHGLSPHDTYHAALNAGLDFLGISDHHNTPTSGAFGKQFTLEGSEYEDGLVAVAEQFNADHAGRFVAIPGIEWGTISNGNHINVFGFALLPTLSH